MPLIKSGSDKAVSTNIKEMVKAGHKPSQAIAAALANQRSAKKKHMAEGGVVDASEGAPEMDTGAIMEKLRAHLTPEEHAHLAKYTEEKGDVAPQETSGMATFPLSEAGESLSPNVREAEEEAPEAPAAEETAVETPKPSEEDDTDFSYAAEMKRKANEYLSDGDEDNGVSLRSMETSVRKPEGTSPVMMSAGGTTKPGSKEDAKSALARRKAKAAMERAAYKPRES